MNSPRYSSAANHIKAQIRKAPAIHRDREPGAANMMSVSVTGCAGLKPRRRRVSMNRSALRGADAELSDHCRAHYTIAPPFPRAYSRKNDLGISNRRRAARGARRLGGSRSEEHTSELQSQFHLVCR